ncbi:MAG: urease accessory protein UreD [Trueperaceae bacterium]
MLLNAVETRQASLELTFAVNKGQTLIASQASSSPLKIWRPFDVGDGRVLVQIVNVSPGVMAGDAYRLKLTIQSGAKVVLVNQSATKLHSMPEGQRAKQNVSIIVADDGELEYYPGLTIPFPNSDFSQHVEVNLAKTAKFVILERFAVGRVERGELHQYRSVSSRARITRENKTIYADRLELTAGVGLLEGHSYVANGVWCWGKHVENKTIQTESLLLVSGQGANNITYLRALAKDGLELKTSLDSIVKTWRKEQGMEKIVFSRFAS